LLLQCLVKALMYFYSGVIFLFMVIGKKV